MSDDEQDVFDVIAVEAFPNSMMLLGEGKFQTPRTIERKVPILVLPWGVSRGLQTYSGREVLTLAFDDACLDAFDRLHAWLVACNDSADRVLQRVVRAADDGVSIARVKLPVDPASCGLFDEDGESTDARQAVFACGRRIRVVVEMSCVWFANDTYGLAMTLVQARTGSQSTPALGIVDDVSDDDDGTVFAPPPTNRAYEPFVA